MKRFFAVAAVALGLLSGCGPAEESEPVESTDTLEQKLTPCLSACYGTCSGNSSSVLACRAACREQCQPCDADPNNCAP